MNRQVATVLSVASLAGSLSQPLLARLQQSPAQSPRIQACSLLAKEEVKKHLPWKAMLDQMAPEEEPIGATGSSCNYPSVDIQVLPFSQGFMDSARKQAGGIEAISGIGDEAYFRNNPNGYAELYVKTGKHIVTLQANVPPDGSIASVKPGVMSLAKALVAKLR